jgi:hypothetical protein
MKRNIALIIVLATLSAFIAPSLGLGFSSQQPITLQEKTANADLIVVGKVTDVQCRWDEPKTLIHTYVSVSIEEIVKGQSPNDKITITMPGGEVGNLIAAMPGMPSFRKGERVLLFLIRDRYSDDLYLVHGVHGKDSIMPDNRMRSTGKTLPEFLNEIRQCIPK